MPQVLKEEVRARIVAAALATFAAEGFEGATMATIAARANLGAATIYRYYASKEELFAAVITPELAERFESLLERRVRALAEVAFGRRRDELGDEMLRFWMEHRLAIVVLLDRARGTPYARYPEKFVEQLSSATLARIRAEQPGVRVSAASRFVLERIFDNTRRMLAAILEQHDREDALREAVEAFWSYQVPGLRGFARRLLE